MAMTRTRSEAEQELLQRSLQNSTWKGQFRSAEGLICCHLMYAEATVDNRPVHHVEARRLLVLLHSVSM